MSSPAPRPGRPALGHRHPSDAGHACGDGRRPRSVTTSTARTRPSRALEDDGRRPARVPRRACSCRPGRWATSSGIRLLVRPGEELVCDSLAHVARAELGAAAVFSGITFRTWAAARGRLEPRAVAELVAPDAGPYLVSTAAIALENTHNFGGRHRPAGRRRCTR